MLDSLEIKNFRNLEHLRIESLGAVNLIIGKNNTGKSSLLEAIMIYASKGDLNAIYQILDDRGENVRQTNSSINATESNLKSLSSLFCNRVIHYNPIEAISIGSLENSLFGKQMSTEKFIALRFVRFYDETITDGDFISNNGIGKRRVILNDSDDYSLIEYRIGLELSNSNNNYILPLDNERSLRMLKGLGAAENYQFVRTKNIDREINGKLWDTITLSEKENFVIDALKIIEPNVERIAFIEENMRQRIAVVKLKNYISPIPLKSMGDGINRILTIILALVNADGGYLLIDEFENGLHHSVQKQLWEIVFFLSKKLNVQVFATTHSEDCIKGFESVLNSDTNDQSGKLIRLDLKKGTVKQVEFDSKELELVTENEIEIR